MNTTDDAVPLLGGVNGDLACVRCGKPRWSTSDLCPACWGKDNEGGTRNSRGDVIQARLPKDVWLAVQFAANMLRKGDSHSRAVRVAAGYYHVDPAEVRSGLSQRSGRNQSGKKRGPRPPKPNWMPVEGQVCKRERCGKELPLGKPAPHGYCRVCWWEIEDMQNSN